MTSQDDTLSINIEDDRALSWIVARLMSRGQWFEYRPNQLARNGKIVRHTVIMVRNVADGLVAEHKEAKRNGEL